MLALVIRSPSDMELFPSDQVLESSALAGYVVPNFTDGTSQILY